MTRRLQLWRLSAVWLYLFTLATRELSSAQCIYDTVVSTISSGGNAPLNRLAMAPDGLTLMVSSIVESATNYQVLVRVGVNADGHLNLMGEKLIQVTGGTLLAAPIAFSGDGLNVYMASPNDAKLYTFDPTNINAHTDVDDTLSEPCFYVGLTSSDTLVVAVFEQEIRRFQRDVLTGNLVPHDTEDVAVLYTISAATADPTGNYVVVVRNALVEVYAVGDAIGAGNVAEVEEISSHSAPNPAGAGYIVMSLDSLSIYLQSASSNNGVIRLVNSLVGGEPTFVGDLVDELPAAGYTFVAIHPDGSYLYALNQETGDLAQHTRGADGALTSLVCTDQTAEVDAYNSMLVSWDGLHLFVADGLNLYSYATHLQTPSPVPAPTLAPTTSAPTTVAPTTVAPTTIAPATNAPITVAPTSAAPTTAAPTTAAPSTPPPSTVAPSTPPPSTVAPSTPPPSTAAPSTPRPSTAAPSTPQPSTAAPSTPQPSTAAPAPVQSPATAGPVVQPDAPLLLSAVLSDTQTTFTLTFSSTCYCSEGTVNGADVSLCGFNAVSGEFDYGCDIERLLDPDTRSLLGFGPTCEWSADSLMASVSYHEASEGHLIASGRNVTVDGGYILGGGSSVSSQTEYTTGTVALEGRTTPPELLQAEFSDDGGTIVVAFSSEGSASGGLLDADDPASGSGPGSCHALLDVSSIPPLGQDASCEWTGARELTIRLGYEAYVVPERLSNTSCISPFSCITLMDGGVRTEAFAMLSSSGSTPVLAPANPPLVSAVVVAPQTVGLCGRFRLDGRSSSGGASRTLSAFWSVSGAEGASYAALATANASLAPFQGSLLAEINATALEVGIDFTFSLAVQSFLGNADEATATVTRSDEDVPSVVVVGAATRTVKRAQSTSLRMTATPPACGESQALTFTWSEDGATGFDEIGTEVLQALDQRDPTTLTLPPYTLGNPGSKYLFTATATSQSSLTSSVASVEVSVGQGALRAVIAGGQFRQHTAGSDLVLDGSGSLDEDEITDLSMRYSWRCSANCTAQNEDSWTTFADASVLSIPSQELEAGMIYEISLNVSKGSLDSSEVYGQLRWDTASVRVQVISFEAPEVVVAAKDDTLKHNPTKKVVVFGSVVEQTGHEYELQWTQAEGDLNLEEDDWSMYFTTPQSGLNLVMRPNVLTGGATYTFRLSALDSVTRTTGFAELSVVVNAPPTGGYVDASPRAGSAAVDMFSLQSLDWTDGVDDLPLLYFFAYANDQEEVSGQPLLSLSMFATESPEWEGPLPLGSPSADYTILIAGQVSDSFGATATASTNATGEAVTVRVAAWAASDGDSGAALQDLYAAALEGTGAIPGGATSTVRAYASLLPDESDESSPPLSAEEIEYYQNLTATMIEDVANDFDVLEYSATTAGAVLDTLALVSGSESSLTRVSKEALLSVSADVLGRAVNYSSWDSDDFTPTLELLNNVIGGYNASPAGVVRRDSLGEESASILPSMVHSMGLLMETVLEDGEDPMVIDSDYINVLCQVTSSTGTLGYETDSSAVFFSEGIVDPAALALRTRRLDGSESQSNRCSPGGELRDVPQGRYPCRRRLQSTSTPATATVTISNVQFNAYGSPSSAAEAAVTSITVTTTSDGEDAPLLAPVQITMRASVSSESHEHNVPTCSYYNDDAGVWDTAGLATESLSSSSGDEGEGGVLLTCLSFHLSDFTVSAEEIEGAFRPVSLAAGVAVILKVREISFMGVVLLLMVLVLLAVVWTVSKMADAKNKLARQLSGKADAWYIATGTSGRHPTLSAVADVDPLDDTHRQRFLKGRRRLQRRGKKMIRRHLMRRLRSRWRQLRSFFRLVMKYHPWFGILSPSSSNLTLTREQLSLLIFSSIMVHMMVKASFIGNSTDYRIQFAQILVSLAVSMPGSIIIPKLFEAASAPPSSLSTKSAWKPIAPSVDWPSAQSMSNAKAHAEMRWLRDSNSVVAVFRLFSATASSAFSRGPHVASGGRQYAAGRVIARGTSLVWSGLQQLLLDLICIAISASVGIEEQVDKALIATTAGGLIVGFVFLDAVLSTRSSSFSIINFKTLFVIVFVRLVLTALQVVLSFHQLRNAASSSGLYMVIFIVSIVKIVTSHKGELVPCMDAVNNHYMDTISMVKRYRPAPANRRKTHTSLATSDPDSAWRESAAIKIQALVRRHQAYDRTTRHQELVVWHCPKVESMRKKLTFRAYTCLAIYTLVVAWINVCYVATYDSTAIRSWIASTALTVLADILLRKPLSVLAVATFYTIRDNVRIPETVFIGTGRSQRPIGQL